jgi:uncharacterized protein involved in exopolysaccharide biosynthesis
VRIAGDDSRARRPLERELAELERRLRAELRRELDTRMLELRQHVDAELEAIQQRIDHVHTRALRALTDRIGDKPQ